jgi:hypothetical protein
MLDFHTSPPTILLPRWYKGAFNERAGRLPMGVYYSHCLIPRDNTIRPSPEQIAALLAAWIEQRFIIPGAATLDMTRGWHRESMAETGACFRTEPPLKTVNEQARPQPEPPKSLWAKLFGAPPAPMWAPDPMMSFSMPPAGASWTALSRPDALIVWAARPDAEYPMETIADLVGEPHHFSIELSDDFVNPYTDSYGVGQDMQQLAGICPCGHDLNFESASDWIDSRRIRHICPRCSAPFRPQDHPAEIIDNETGAKIPCPGAMCRRFAISIDFGRDFPDHRRAENGELIHTKPQASDLFLRTSETALGFELKSFDDYS